MHAKSPLVWALQGSNAGDNAQVRELAARLQVHTEVKNLSYNWLYGLPNYLLGATLASVEKGDEILKPPWPDLVIAIGRRSVPVARWIKKMSGGRARLVHLGRPRARLDVFDLVVTTPQYRLPRAPNVIELMLPLVPHRPLPDAELTAWSEAFADLPRPMIAVLVGGPTWPFLMRDGEVANLVSKAEIDAPSTGRFDGCDSVSPNAAGYLPNAVDALGRYCRHFSWGGGQGNPYRALLRLADHFVVTSDSVSMLTEALRTEKPVDVYQLPTRQLATPAAAALAIVVARQVRAFFRRTA